MWNSHSPDYKSHLAHSPNSHQDHRIKLSDENFSPQKFYQEFFGKVVLFSSYILTLGVWLAQCINSLMVLITEMMVERELKAEIKDCMFYGVVNGAH